MRLDIALSKKLDISRNKASEMIKKSLVNVNGKCINKPSFEVEESDEISASETLFVSRAGEKLDGFLSEFSVDIEDKTCLDIGSSTGGFSQVLLKNGAFKVVCVDVGSEQLHQSLRQNEKIELYENTDVREFKSDYAFDVVTCDVSFISFKDIAYYVDKFANNDIIILFKPQFEVGREVKRSKKGVVMDKKAIQKAHEEFEKIALSYGWKLQTKVASKVAGKEGNLESFYAYKK